MLRADVPGIDSRLLEQRVRQELAANPTDPVLPPPPDNGRPAGTSTAGGSSSILTSDAERAAPPEAPAAPLPVSPPSGPEPGGSEPNGSEPNGSEPNGSEPSQPQPAGLIGRMMARLGALYRQHSPHHQVQRRFSEIWLWAGETADRVHELSRQIDALRLQLSALGDQHREFATLNRAQVEKQRALYDALHDEHKRWLARLDRAVVRIEGDLRFEHRRLARLIDVAGEGRPRALSPGEAAPGEGGPAESARVGPDQAQRDQARPAALSVASELSGRFAQGFEERFRGSRDDIKGRLRVHLDRVRGQPVVTPRHPLLDIGCGRGEWLELLAEAVVPAYGIDANAQIVDACQRRGLAVSQADALEHLARLPEHALGAISAFHLIEHLPLEDMLRLIDEARRTLVPNGILMLETPNPENLKVGALTFHQDPTHLRPLPPVLVEYLVSSRGFHQVELMRLHPYPASSLVNEDSEAARRLNELLYGPQDIAVLARRA